MEQFSWENYPEYDNHSLVVPIDEHASVPLRGFVAIHRQNPGFASLGATRLWAYENTALALQDALRLSRLMSYKSVLAGLPYGGAKAALVLPPGGIANRESFFRAYGRQIAALAGKFVTGTDVGVHNSDLDYMLMETKFVIGQGVDAGYFTALGVFEGIKVLLRALFNSEDISARRFAVQGLGKTGWNLVKFLHEEGARKIYITDLDTAKMKAAVEKFPGVEAVAPQDIFSKDVDVFSPCALHGVLNKQTITELRCQAVAGSANNQLADLSIGEDLYRAGILYAPDYLINAGGLISVVDQYENQTHDEKRICEKIINIVVNLKHVVDTSRLLKLSTNVVADQIAEKKLANISPTYVPA